MKKLWIISLLSIFFVSDCSLTKDTSRSSVVDGHGEVSSHIVRLLELTGISHDGTLEDIVDQTQSYWLRKPDQERWHIEQYITKHEDEIRSIFDKLGMSQAIKPMHQEYDYVLIMGGLFKTIILRLQYAIDFWKQGVRFKKIVFLGGARPAVDQRGEHVQAYTEWLEVNTLNEQEPQTESEIMKFVYKHIQMPEGMRELPVQFIDAAMISQEDGSMRRPATDDIINDWLVTNPVPGYCLFISTQPYVGFQDAVVKTYVPKDFNIDTVGPVYNSSLNIGIILDNLARWLYQEKKRLEKH